jgi:hypothetical protein
MLGLSGVQTVWHVIRTDGTVDRWASGRDGTVVRTANREPILLTCTQCRFSETLLNSGIPVIKHLYKQVILSNQNEANYNLTLASSVRTSRIFRPDLPLCREALNCSSLHPSGRFSSTSGRHLVFDQLWDFFPKHRYGKTAGTIRTMWILVRTRSFIRQVVHSKSRRPDVSPHGSDARASYMEIAYIRSTVWSTYPMVQTREALIWKLRAAKVRPSRRQGKILESRLHNCPSGRLMSTVRMAPRYFKPNAHLNL